MFIVTSELIKEGGDEGLEGIGILFFQPYHDDSVQGFDLE
jgi:hypothetical protein